MRGYFVLWVCLKIGYPQSCDLSLCSLLECIFWGTACFNQFCEFQLQDVRVSICRYWDSRKCFNGMSCPFAHSESELREQPVLQATGLCYDFASGHCRRGQACHFAHGQHELRSLPRAQRASVSLVVAPQAPQNTNLHSMVKQLHQVEEMLGRMMLEVQMLHLAVAPDRDDPWASTANCKHFIQLLSHFDGQWSTKCIDRTEISNRGTKHVALRVLISSLYSMPRLEMSVAKGQVLLSRLGSELMRSTALPF